MASLQSISLRSPAGFSPLPPPPPQVNIPAFNPVPKPVIPTFDGSRINAGAEQSILDKWGTLDEKYRFEREYAGTGLKNQLSGLNFKFETNPDGTLRISSTNQLGIRQRQDVRGQQNVGAARNQLYSSFTDQAIGDALQRLGKYATENIAQYGSNIKKINDNYLTETQDLGERLSGYLTDDAKWAIQNPPPPPPPTPAVGAGLAGGLGLEPWGNMELDAGGHPIVWKGRNPPNPQTIQQQFPNMTWSTRRTGDGQYVVVLGGYAPAAWSAINQSLARNR